MKASERVGRIRGFCSMVVLTLAVLASPALAQKADRPEVKVGDEWQFIQYSLVPIQKPNLAWVITSVTPSGIAGTSNGGPLTLTQDLNIVESPTHKFSDRRHLSVPLEIGKSWTYKNHAVFKSFKLQN